MLGYYGPQILVRPRKTVASKFISFRIVLLSKPVLCTHSQTGLGTNNEDQRNILTHMLLLHCDLYRAELTLCPIASCKHDCKTIPLDGAVHTKSQ